jgi:hypothetical protein
MTSIKDIEAMGAVASEKPVRKEIEFKVDGTDYKATIHVREIGVDEYERLFVNKDQGSNAARQIAETIRLGETGEEVITLDMAKRLKPQLAAAMITASTEVNFPKKS